MSEIDLSAAGINTIEDIRKQSEQAKEPVEQVPAEEQLPKDLPGEEKKIYNYAGMFADIVLHIEQELTNQLIEHPWNAKVKNIVQGNNEIVEFYDVEVPKTDRENLGIKVGHTIEFAKFPSETPGEFSYIERINLMINDELYGNLTHVSSEEIFERALALANRKVG